MSHILEETEIRAGGYHLRQREPKTNSESQLAAKLLDKEIAKADAANDNPDRFVYPKRLFLYCLS